MPGLAKACNPNLSVPNGAVYLYSQSWTISILIAGTVYYICHKIKPVPVTSAKHDEYLYGVEKGSDVGLDADAETSREKVDGGKAFEV